MQEQLFQINNTLFYFDDGHGDYNRSYERSYDDFDYADYSTDHRDNNFRNFEKKRKPNEVLRRISVTKICGRFFL